MLYIIELFMPEIQQLHQQGIKRQGKEQQIGEHVHKSICHVPDKLLIVLPPAVTQLNIASCSLF